MSFKEVLIEKINEKEKLGIILSENDNSKDKKEVNNYLLNKLSTSYIPFKKR